MGNCLPTLVTAPRFLLCCPTTLLPQAFVATLENQKAASCVLDVEAANNRASLLLAESLSARESWYLRVAQHDARFARALSACSSEEWEEQGDLLSDPLHDLPPRPCSPGRHQQNNSSLLCV
jgi:hypothetical protein